MNINNEIFQISSKDIYIKDNQTGKIIENETFDINSNYDLNNKNLHISNGTILNFNGGSLSNGTLILPQNCNLQNPKFNNIILKGYNTCFTNQTINILDIYEDFITYKNDKIYGVDKAINEFINSLHDWRMIHGIIIKIPAGNYVISETIKLIVGVSLEGTAGTTFELDFRNSNSDHIGILVDPYYYGSTGTNPNINEIDKGYWGSIYRCHISYLTIRSSIKDGNIDYIGIKDNHGTHNIEYMTFGGCLKRYLICENSISGFLRYYGDGRVIRNIHIGDESWDDYKIFIGPGDNQIIEGITGHSRVVCVRSCIHIRNCVTTEFIFVDCGNVIMDSCYSEVTGVRIYNSLVLINGCTFGTPEHGVYNSATGVLRYRDKFLNCIEIDTTRIITDLLNNGIISNPDINGNNWLNNMALRSNVTLNNVKLIGLDYRRDNKLINDEDTVRSNEFNYILRNPYSKGKITVTGSLYAQPNYNSSASFLRIYPLDSLNAQLLPACLEIGETVNTCILQNNTLSVSPISLDINKQHEWCKDMRNFSDMEEGTYYYRVGVMASLQHFIGDISNEVNITINKVKIPYIENNIHKEIWKCPVIKLSLNALIESNQTIVIWRGTESNHYTEMAYFTVPKGGIGRNYYTFKSSNGNWQSTFDDESKTNANKYIITGDSKGMINGVKWKSCIRNPFILNKSTGKYIENIGLKKSSIIKSITRISDKNYKINSVNNVDSEVIFKQLKSNLIAITNDEININGNIYIVTNAVSGSYHFKLKELSNKQGNTENRPSNILTNNDGGTQFFDTDLNKTIYAKVNNDNWNNPNITWYDNSGNNV